MEQAAQFLTAQQWQAALGLLPMPLRESADNGERYVLVNGVSGNFCLDLVGGLDRTSQRAAAWSCDVGHYVTCVDATVYVNRWDRRGHEEKYSWRSVVSQLHDFHRHLEQTTPDRSKSIVPHVLRIFRQIRAALEEEQGGLRSLRVLLHLLAANALGEYRLAPQHEQVSGLTSEMLQASQAIPDSTWVQWYNDLAGIGRYDVLRPDFGLVLRHASGAVFQDAHLEAELSDTAWLPGLERAVTINPKALPTETGIYFTPPALARTLAEEAVRNVSDSDKKLRLFDPACGSGELLKECLRLLKLRSFRGPVEIIGWDRSAASTEMARFVLQWEKRAWEPNRVEIDIRREDSLTVDEWPTGVDVLVMNPPFKSWQRMTEDEQAAMTKLLGTSQRPNLALAFALRGASTLSKTGAFAMVAPNSLLEATSARGVRAALSEILAPQLIARLGDQTIFARALVDAGMYVGHGKDPPQSPTAILWADSRPHSLSRALRGLRRWRGAEVEPLVEDGFSIYQRSDVGASGAPWMARSYDAWQSYERVRRTRLTVPAKKLFDVRQGVRLGNDVFILNEAQLQLLPTEERPFFRPAVMNPSISDGKLVRGYCVFYPYSAGLASIETEEQLQNVVPVYYREYLLPTKAKLASRKTLAKANLNWWELLWHRSWQTELRPKIVSKYFGGAKSFAFDATGEFVVVVGNAWLLKPGAIDLSVTDEEVYAAMLAYLCSTVSDGLIQYVSVQVSGGQWDLSNRYIGELPIINVAKLGPAQFDRLAQMGNAIAAGSIGSWSEVDDLVQAILAQ